MKKAIYFIAGATVLIFSFQNCAPSFEAFDQETGGYRYENRESFPPSPRPPVDNPTPLLGDYTPYPPKDTTADSPGINPTLAISGGINQGGLTEGGSGQRPKLGTGEGNRYHYYKFTYLAEEIASITLAPYPGTQSGRFNMWVSLQPGGEAFSKCSTPASFTGGTLTIFNSQHTSRCVLPFGEYYLNIADAVGGRYDWHSPSCDRNQGCSYRLTVSP